MGKVAATWTNNWVKRTKLLKIDQNWKEICDGRQPTNTKRERERQRKENWEWEENLMYWLFDNVDGVENDDDVGDDSDKVAISGGHCHGHRIGAL